MKAFISGHRNINRQTGLTGIKLLVDKVQNEITHYYCGMALSTDQLFAEYLIYKKLSFSAILPYPEQHEKWSIYQQKHYFYLLKYAQETIIVSPEYTSAGTHLRNDYMINHSKICLAIYDNRNYGGTKSVIDKCLNKGLRTIIFNPKTEKITEYEQLSLLV